METKGPTVSVIISAHNRPAYLMEALKSLQGQTAPFDKFEVIVVKDYELDLSKIDVGKMAVTFIDTSDSYLVSKHIAGIKASRGDYIALMDDDDLFSATKIERILSLSQYMVMELRLYHGILRLSFLELNLVLSNISKEELEV